MTYDISHTSVIQIQSWSSGFSSSDIFERKSCMQLSSSDKCLISLWLKWQPSVPLLLRSPRETLTHLQPLSKIRWEDSSPPFPSAHQEKLQLIFSAHVASFLWSVLCEYSQGCLDPVTKIQEVSREDVAWGVRILIKKQITEFVITPRGEFIKPN